MLGILVGITHNITIWQGKLFRLIKKEELQDFEVKLTFEEYVPSVYKDFGSQFFNHTSFKKKKILSS